MLKERYFFDDYNPSVRLTLKEIQHQFQSLLDMSPSDERTFADYLFDCDYRKGGTLHECFD